MECPECYAEEPRITPLKGAESCLKKHRQYICSCCGRMLCADLGGEKRARCFMPFGSAETARLYLRAAEVISGGPCGIYELIYSRGEKRYRIFRNEAELREALQRNKTLRCERFEPVSVSGPFSPAATEQLRGLTADEAQRYLHEWEAAFMRSRADRRS